MAYRRKHSNPRSSTYEDFGSSRQVDLEPSSPSSLAAQAIRASSAHRDSSLSSAYGESAHSHAYRESDRHQPRESSARDPNTYEYTSIKSLNESKNGFWGVLAQKAKSILEDDNAAPQLENQRSRSHVLDASSSGELGQPYKSFEGHQKKDNPKFQKRLDSLTSSLNYIGGRVGNALEEGISMVENRTAGIIQETRKLNIRRKETSFGAQNKITDLLGQQNMSQIQAEHETQLKASRDVANAMAAKAKLLLRELKTLKADMAFAKERCSQLEEENKILRESREKGDHPEDDDLIRLQLETLLAEKARLAHENSTYARENRFLREIVEYHQLTMQDVVYFDEGIEEVTEVYNASRSPSPSITTPQASTPNASSQPSPRTAASGSHPVPLSPQASAIPGLLPIAPAVQEAGSANNSSSAVARPLQKPVEEKSAADV